MPPFLPRNCGHIKEVAFGETDKYMHSNEATSEKVAAIVSDH